MRDIGVRTAIYGRILFVALGLVAAVGTAVVYFVGGNLAISERSRPGTVIAFMMYVGQMYQPLAQLTNSRVDILTALVSFERVFEVLDFPASIADRPGAVDLVDPQGASSSSTCGSAIRPAIKSRSRRWRRPERPAATSRANGSCATSPLKVEPGETRRARRALRARARPPSRCSCRACTRSRKAW